jgi:hypothetical protein
MLGKKVEKEKYMLMEAIQLHNEQVQALIGSDYAPATFKGMKHRINIPCSSSGEIQGFDIDITKA